MAKAKGSDLIKELHAILEKDWKGTYRKYPDQAIFALNDDRVIKAIDKRFDNNGTIKEIRSLHYDFYTGLIPLCFEFTSSTGSTGLPSPDAFLLLMNGDCEVVAIIDPFDPIQPNQFLPPLPKEGEQPFVLARPSLSDKRLTFSDEELYPLQVRSREFFRKLIGGGQRSIQSSRMNAAGDVIIIIATSCPYMTFTPRDYAEDEMKNDECGKEDDIIWEA